MRSLFIYGISTLLLAGLAGCATTQKNAPALNMASMKTSVGDDQRGAMVYLPENYDPGHAWPLIVFLHGAGEQGNDGLKQTTVGLPVAIKKNPERFPCLVLMPQCAPGDTWWSATAKSHIDKAIEQTLESYNIDRTRISLTGLSLGGFGSFAYGADHPELFSAIMPVCGGGAAGDPDVIANLAKTPMRVFHGADDHIIPPRFSRDMVAAIKAAGGTIQYTEYPDTKHNSWDQAYGDPEAIAWLLAQRSK